MEELLDKPVDENTKVWFEGLPKWYPAGTLDEMKPLFDGSLSTERSETAASEVSPEERETTAEPTAEAAAVASEAPKRFAPGRIYVPRQQPGEPCPPTYLGWTIFLTICCCSPVSLASLIASICVSSYYNSGRVEHARKASDVTAWLIMVAVALGFLPVMLMSIISGA